MISVVLPLTLKGLCHFFQYTILFPNVVQHMCNIFYETCPIQWMFNQH